MSGVNELVAELEPDLIRVRRDIHRHPELGWQEFRTTAIIAEWMTALGYQVKLGRDV